jgi:Dna[CI] antecedent, DciA
MRSSSDQPDARRSRSGVDQDVLASVRARRATRRARTSADDGERPSGSAVPLASALAGFLREHRIGSRDPLQALAPLLAELAGARLATHLRPARLRGRELCVYVDSPSLLAELTAFTGRALEQRFVEAVRARRLAPVDRLVFRHAH